ncbi:MAG: hypothetical protein AAF800_09515 [Planctomycetota bacterium]
MLSATGCGSPPSVLPTMGVVERTLRDEADHAESTGAAFDTRYFDRVLADLDRAFRADLEATGTFSPAWVAEATTAYVAAREGVLRESMRTRSQRRQRIDNLRAAADAQARAAALLAQQDGLRRRVVGFDLWRLEPFTEEGRP